MADAIWWHSYTFTSRATFLKESTGLWLKAQIRALEWFVGGNMRPLDIFCFLSITVGAPAVIYGKQFVWITPALTVSCLFGLPEDDAKHFTPALESQLNECACNKGNRVRGEDKNYSISGCCLLFLFFPFWKRFWSVKKNTKKKKKGDLQTSTAYLAVFCIASLSAVFFQLTRTELRKEECMWNITAEQNLKLRLIALVIFC